VLYVFYGFAEGGVSVDICLDMVEVPCSNQGRRTINFYPENYINCHFKNFSFY